MPRNQLIQVRRGTAADWTSANPTLAAGEFGFETDTFQLKCGDGSTAWNSLAYIGGSGMEIGEEVVGGTATRVLFVDSSGDLGDDASLTYSAASSRLTTVEVLVTSLKLRDSNQTHTLQILCLSNLTQNRIINLVTGDADRILTFTNDASIGGTNTGDQTITLTGDVTGTGTGSFATTIAAGVVTYAKIQDVSADSRILGRALGAGSGDVTELTAAQTRAVLVLATTDTPQFAGLGVGQAGAASSITILKNSAAFANCFEMTADTLVFRFGAESATVGEGHGGSWSANRFSIFTDSGRRVTYHQNNANGNPGNITIGTASNPGGGAPCVVSVDSVTNPSSMPTNTAGWFSKDVAGTTEFFTIDEAGNATQQTPHAKDAPEAMYDMGRGLDLIHRTEVPYPIDGARFGRPGEMLEGVIIWLKPTGQRAVESFAEYAARMGYDEQERTRRGYIARSWDEDQEAKRVHRDKERVEWGNDKASWDKEEEGKETRSPFPKKRPEPYQKKPKPPWEK